VAKHKGNVVFVEGVHYAVDKDGHANKDKPLRWDDADGGYRDAKEGEGLHNDLVESNPVVVEPGSE
jgi:hypothetical protein